MSGAQASRLSALIAFGFWLGATPSLANFRDGDDLLRQCTATIGAEMDFCYGYIDAVTDYLLEHNVMGQFAACITRDLDDSRVRDLIVRFLQKNPALRRLGAPQLIARALAEAFPCQ
jgi:hypothetical protein